MAGWRDIADRAIGGLGVCPGEVIQIREHSGRSDVLLEMMLAVERAGGTPLVELTPPSYLQRLLGEAHVDSLAVWDRYRSEWLRQVDRVLVLQGADINLDAAPELARAAWSRAVERLIKVEEERRLPYLLVAVPTSDRAAALSQSLEALEAQLVAALAVPVDALRQDIERVLTHVRDGHELIIRSADRTELRMSIVGRQWLADDGCIDAEDQRRGGHVSNLPAGSVYTTAVETSAAGQLWLPQLGNISGVRLTFADGRIVAVAGSEGRERFQALLDRHSGDYDRISHIGIGLNPSLDRVIGWTLVDEHVHGALFVALGENRYLGGQNQSSLNIDFALPEATLLIDGALIVEAGRLCI